MSNSKTGIIPRRFQDYYFSRIAILFFAVTVITAWGRVVCFCAESVPESDQTVVSQSAGDHSPAAEDVTTQTAPAQEKDGSGMPKFGKEPLAAGEKDKEKPIEVTGDNVSFSLEGKVMVASGNVKLVYEDVILFCDRAEVDMVNKLAKLNHNVKLVHKQGMLFADRMNYDFGRKKADILNMDMQMVPFNMKSERAEKVSDEEYVMHDGYVTTCNLEQPHYRMTAKKIVMYPNDKMIAYNLVLKVGEVPVFYLPYFEQDLREKEPFFMIVPGRDKRWGTFALTTFNYKFPDAGLKGKVHLDFYEKNGIGTGITNTHSLDTWGNGWTKLYYINDTGNEDDDPNFEEGSSRDRYKMQLRHYAQPTKDVKILLAINKFSDETFMRDFFRKEYERDVHPLSHLNVDYTMGQNSVATLLVQGRINKYNSETEYLPSLQYRLFPYSINQSNFYIDLESSASNLYLRSANTDEYSHTERFDAHPKLSYRDNIGPIAVQPYVGIRDTFYSEDASGSNSVNRYLYETGTTLSTKMSRIFVFSKDDAELIRMRHIITPIVSYAYLSPSNVMSENLIKFDGIDSASNSHGISFALDNKLQTKKNKNVNDLLYVSPSVNYSLKTRGQKSGFSTGALQTEITPIRGFSLTTYDVYNFPSRYWSNTDTGLHVHPNTKLDASVHYRRVGSTKTSMTSELIPDITVSLSSLWSLRSYHQFNLTTNKVTLQQYTLRRDLHCWWMDLGVDVDSASKTSFYVVFTLKAFPGLHVNAKGSIAPQTSN